MYLDSKIIDKVFSITRGSAIIADVSQTKVETLTDKNTIEYKIRLYLDHKRIIYSHTSLLYVIDIDILPIYTYPNNYSLGFSIYSSSWELMHYESDNNKIENLEKDVIKAVHDAINRLKLYIKEAETEAGKTVYCDTDEKLYNHRGIILTKGFGI